MKKQLVLAVLAARLAEGDTDLPVWQAARLMEIATHEGVGDVDELHRLQELSIDQLAQEVITLFEQPAATVEPQEPDSLGRS